MIHAALAPILDEGLWGFFVFACAISVIALFAAAFQDYVPGVEQSEDTLDQASSAKVGRSSPRVPDPMPRPERVRARRR